MARGVGLMPEVLAQEGVISFVVLLAGKQYIISAMLPVRVHGDVGDGDRL